MKKFKLSNLRYSTTAMMALLISGLIFQSCATRFGFSVSQVVPAAQGSVKVNKDGNNNYKINLDVKHLAASDRLIPSKKMYIVWMSTETNGTKNIGKLKTSSGLFSSTLTSSLKTVTSFKPTGFLITAEDDATIQTPGSQVVFENQRILADEK